MEPESSLPHSQVPATFVNGGKSEGKAIPGQALGVPEG